MKKRISFKDVHDHDWIPEPESYLDYCRICGRVRPMDIKPDLKDDIETDGGDS